MLIREYSSASMDTVMSTFRGMFSLFRNAIRTQLRYVKGKCRNGNINSTSQFKIMT